MRRCTLLIVLFYIASCNQTTSTKEPDANIKVPSIVYQVINARNDNGTQFYSRIDRADEDLYNQLSRPGIGLPNSPTAKTSSGSPGLLTKSLSFLLNNQ
jgi:hypothetical protein